MSDQDLRHGWHAVHEALHRVIGRCTPTSRVIEGDGFVAAVVPERADRSLFNGVSYADGEALVAALPDLARAYEDAGVEAWTVWVHPGDDEVANALEVAGHRLDASPELMAARLDEIDLSPRREVLVERGTWDEVTAVNGVAFPFAADAFDVLAGIGDGLDRWVVRRDGHAVACGVSLTHNGCVEPTFVASLPEVRGMGLVTELLRHVLRGARDAGAVMTTLEATQMGRPVYARMGYRELGPVQMWERRTA